MKYIDADLLRKEIEHRIDILSDVSIKCAKNDDMEMHNYYHGKAISLDELLSFIDSLQQELDLIVINKKDWEAQEQFRKNKDFGKPLRQEQPKTDLDADIEMEWDSFNKHLAEYGNESEEVVWLNWNNFNDIARYFYKLGFNTRKEA